MSLELAGAKVTAEVEQALEEGALLTGVIVIAKVAHLDGTTGLSYNYDGVDWLERRGMLDEVMESERRECD